MRRGEWLSLFHSLQPTSSGAADLEHGLLEHPDINYDHCFCEEHSPLAPRSPRCTAAPRTATAVASPSQGALRLRSARRKRASAPPAGEDGGVHGALSGAAALPALVHPLRSAVRLWESGRRWSGDREGSSGRHRRFDGSLRCSGRRSEGGGL